MNRLTNRGFAALLGTIVPLLTPACATRSVEESGSSTHFLRECDRSSECGRGLSCICGRCSSECTDNSECAGLSSDAVCGDPTTLGGSCSSGSLPDQACVLSDTREEPSGDAGDDPSKDTNEGPLGDAGDDTDSPLAEQACVQTNRQFTFHVYDGTVRVDDEVACASTRQGPYIFGTVTGSESTARGTSYAFELCESGARAGCRDERDLRIEIAFEDADEGSSYEPTLTPTIPENFAYAPDCGCTEACRASIYTLDPVSGPRLTWAVNAPVPRFSIGARPLSCTADDEYSEDFVAFHAYEWPNEPTTVLTQASVATIQGSRGTLQLEVIDSSTMGDASQATAPGAQFIAQWTRSAPAADIELDQAFNEARASWADVGERNYVMTVGNTCFGCFVLPDMNVEVTVIDGKIQSALGRDMNGDYTVEVAPNSYSQWYTAAGLFQLVARAHEEADSLQVIYHEEYGVPTFVDVDPIEGLFDEEYTLTVTSFELL